MSDETVPVYFCQFHEEWASVWQDNSYCTYIQYGKYILFWNLANEMGNIEEATEPTIYLM